MFIGRGITPFMPKITGGVAPFSNAYSLLLDGVDEYVNIDAVRTALASTTVGTISLWVKPVDATPANGRLISFGDTNANEFITLVIDSIGRLAIALGIGGVTQFNVRTTSQAFADNTWGHCAVVIDGVQPVLYVNGIAVAQTNIISTDLTKWIADAVGLDNARIGSLNYNSTGDAGFFNGNFDEVLFVNRALTSGEITTLYNGGTPKDETAIANGVSQFRFDGDTVSTCSDAIGSNDGTYVNVEQADIETDVP